MVFFLLVYFWVGSCFAEETNLLSQVDKISSTLSDGLQRLQSDQGDLQKNGLVRSMRADEKMAFCLNSRGWVVPTPTILSKLEKLAFYNAKWTDDDKAIIDHLTKNGLGFSLIRLFKHGKSIHYKDLLSVMKHYASSRPACPIGCSFDVYRSFGSKLTLGQMDRLAKLCGKHCAFVPKPTILEERWCSCMLDVDKQMCTEADIKLRAFHEDMHQKVFDKYLSLRLVREYKYYQADG